MSEDERPWSYGSDENPAEEQPDAAPKTVYTDRGFPWGLIVILLLAVGIVALAVQNTRSVRIEWLFFDFSAPLVVVLLVTGIVAVIISEILGTIVRRRRRRRLEEKEELDRLRARETDQD